MYHIHVYLYVSYCRSRIQRVTLAMILKTFNRKSRRRKRAASYMYMYKCTCISILVAQLNLLANHITINTSILNLIKSNNCKLPPVKLISVHFISGQYTIDQCQAAARARRFVRPSKMVLLILQKHLHVHVLQVYTV